MGGIAGILNVDPANPVSSVVLETMSGAIHHRGPDRRALFLSGPVGLAERRLGSMTSQPEQLSHNEDCSVFAAVDGRITNSAGLRDVLGLQGHVLSETGEGAPIPHLYEACGLGFVEHLRGFYSIALWDAPRKLLMLVRDRVGVKPLYYWERPEALLFGSELKSVCWHCDNRPSIDLHALSCYLSLGFVPDPETIWVGPQKLLPGYMLLARDGRVTLRRYWLLPEPNGEVAEDEQELAERLQRVTQEAVRSCLPEDAKVGIFLSGGLDSSTLTAVAARLVNRPVQTFTVGYNEQDYCEFSYAEKVASRLGTEHHELVIGPDSLGLIQRLVECFDEPFGDPAALPTYVASEQASGLVSVALLGEGNDELFAGCERYIRARHAMVLDWIPSILRHALRPLSRILSWETRGKNYLYRASLDNGLDRYMDDVMVPLPMKRNLLAPEFSAQLEGLDVSDSLLRWLPPQSEMGLLDQLVYMDMRSHVPGDLLTKVDRTTMAHSLDARVPFLDDEYVGLVSRLPTNLKMRGSTCKVLFRRAFEELLPLETITRPKMGCNIPLRHWFAGVWQDHLRDMLLTPRALQRGYFRRSCIERLIDEHARHRRNNSSLLWRLLFLEVWHRQADSPGAE